MSSDDLRGKATRSIGWVIAERWGSRLVSVGVLMVLTRVLDPGDFGLVSLATSVIAIVQVFVDSGFSTALIQKKKLEPKDASTAFWTSLAIAVILCIGLVATAPLVGILFNEPAITPIIQVLSLSLPILSLSRIPAGMLEREFNFKSLSIRQIIGSIGGAAVAIPAALLGYGVWALVAQTMVSAVVGVVVLWASTPWRPRFEYSFESLKNLRAVGTSVLGIELLDAIQGNIDKIVVGAFFSAEELGIYYVAQRLGTLLVELVTSVISRISLTTFSRVQDDLPRVNRIFRQLTFAAAAISFPIFGLVAVLAPQLVPAFFGSGWEASIPLIWILAPGWAVAALTYFDRGVLLGTGNAGTAFGLALFQNIIGIALVFLFLPLGIIGVAVSRLARIFTWPIRLFIMHRLIQLDVGRYLFEAVRCLVAILPALILIACLQLTAWADAQFAFWAFAVPLAALGLASYAGLLWLVAGEDNRKLIRPVFTAVRLRFRPRHA